MKPVTSPISPGRCREPAIALNGQPLGQSLTPRAFQRIEREWHPGDQVVLSLPVARALKRWPQGGLSLELGPLTLSLPVTAPLEIETADDSAQFPDEFRLSNLARGRKNLTGFPSYCLSPTSVWAYALAME